MVKANQDLMRAGATLREAMSVCGHGSKAVNVRHYQSDADGDRLCKLVARTFGKVRLVKVAV